MGKNMKAQTFLEWCKDKPSLDYFGRKIFDIVDFYSQTFKPEMITELFEGWGLDKSVTYDFYLKKEGIVITMPNRDDPANGDFIKYETIESEIGTTYPETLNDFISDCNRAGIELTWKPEIVKEYFS